MDIGVVCLGVAFAIGAIRTKNALLFIAGLIFIIGGSI
jgi:hypothetical protein